MRSIELVFDDSTEASIRDDWSRLAAAGIPSLAGHSSPSNRPHLTLAAGPGLEVPPNLHGLLQMLPAEVPFSGVQVFPAGRDRYVLARSVTMTARLLRLHGLLHAEISEALPLTRPGAWTPHVTLARRLSGDQLGRAVDLLDLRLEGMCAGARLWDSSTKTVTPLKVPPGY